MSAQDRDRETADYAITTTLTRHAPALAKLIRRRNDTALLDGISIRWRGAEVMVVVRATDLVSFRPLVCFGSGDSLGIAIRNVSIAIGKCQWKDDKFAMKG